MIEARAEIEQLVRPLGFLHEVDHEVGRAAHETRGAHRPARRDDRQDFAGVEDALPVHADAMQRHRHERVVLHFVFGKFLDVLDVIERVVFAGRVVLPEFDLGAERGRFGGHAVFHPPARARR